VACRGMEAHAGENTGRANEQRPPLNYCCIATSPRSDICRDTTRGLSFTYITIQYSTVQYSTALCGFLHARHTSPTLNPLSSTEHCTTVQYLIGSPALRPSGGPIFSPRRRLTPSAHSSLEPQQQRTALVSNAMGGGAWMAGDALPGEPTRHQRGQGCMFTGAKGTHCSTLLAALVCALTVGGEHATGDGPAVPCEDGHAGGRGAFHIQAVMSSDPASTTCPRGCQQHHCSAQKRGGMGSRKKSGTGRKGSGDGQQKEWTRATVRHSWLCTSGTLNQSLPVQHAGGGARAACGRCPRSMRCALRPLPRCLRRIPPVWPSAPAWRRPSRHTAPSSPPEASRAPSDEKASADTESECPGRTAGEHRGQRLLTRTMVAPIRVIATSVLSWNECVGRAGAQRRQACCAVLCRQECCTDKGTGRSCTDKSTAQQPMGWPLTSQWGGVCGSSHRPQERHPVPAPRRDAQNVTGAARHCVDRLWTPQRSQQEETVPQCSQQRLEHWFPSPFTRISSQC